MIQFVIPIAIAVLAYVFYTIPSVLDPVIWKNPTPLTGLDGAAAPNTILQHAFKVQGDFSGPESFAVDENTGVVYAGFSDGSIGSFRADGGLIGRVLFIGRLVNPTASEGLLDWCKNEALSKRLPWNQDGERRCGRPLGLRIQSEAGGSALYVLDAYHGLFAVNLTDMSVQHLITSATPIHSLGTKAANVDPVAMLPLRFMNDLTMLPSGEIYFTDSSYLHTRSENREEALDGAPRGRLFRYNLHSKQLHVMMCGLHFPNGVQHINFNGKMTVLVGELARFRILQVDVEHPDTLSGHYTESCVEDGSLHGAIEKHSFRDTGVGVFADSVPGVVDNIRLHKDHVYVGLGSKSAKPFSIIYLAYQSLWLRQVIGKLAPMKHVEKLLPKYGLVLVYDQVGQIVASYHDPAGKTTSFISQATVHPLTGDMWIGSHSEAFVAILPRKYLAYPV
eukprot:gene31207-37715_t